MQCRPRDVFCRGTRHQRLDWSAAGLRGGSPARRKRVIAFVGEGHFDPAALASNTFDIEWPPRSGRRQNFPEVDSAEWFNIELARTKMLSGQMELLDRLLAIAGESTGK
jgi:predicted NUDIX family NTP pyrophosphohydrolase